MGSSTTIQAIRFRSDNAADPKDVAAYKKAIAEAKSENEALKVGDNGIGVWGDNTAHFFTLILFETYARLPTSQSQYYVAPPAQKGHHV